MLLVLIKEHVYLTIDSHIKVVLDPNGIEAKKIKNTSYSHMLLGVLLGHYI